MHGGDNKSPPQPVIFESDLSLAAAIGHHWSSAHAMNSVLTTLRVFETVSARQPIGLSDLSRELDIPKSTVQRCLRTLAEAGWARQTRESGGDWIITGRAFSVGSAVASNQHLREVALPLLSQLQEETKETVHLAVPDGQEMILIERLDSPHHLRAFMALGTRLPLHAASNGKAYIAAFDDSVVEAYIANSGLPPVTEFTVTDPDVFRKEVRATRVRGYAITSQELQDGISSIAAALAAPRGEIMGSFSISGPSTRITPSRYDEYGQMVRATKAAIERWFL
jgi:IclR family transcriptional regulator, acetate operon repressor